MKKTTFRYFGFLILLCAVVMSFTACAPKTTHIHIAAIIRPSVEELKAERAALLKELEIEAKNQVNTKRGFFSSRSFAENVMNDSSQLVSVDEVVMMFDKIEESLGMNKSFRLVDRKRIDRILEQHNFEESAWSDDDKVAEVGKVLNVDTLIFLEKGIFFPKEERKNKKEYELNGAPIQVRIEFLDVNTFTSTVRTVTTENEISWWTQKRKNTQWKRLKRFSLD